MPRPVTDRISGHAFMVERKRGPQWYVKFRMPDGQQVKRLLGPAWTGRGRTPAGYFTKRSADEALHAMLTDARRGTLTVNRTGATFDDAAAEYLRYVEHVKKIGRATLSDYRGVISGYLSPRFGERALDSITPADVERYRDELDAEGRLSARVIVRHLTVLHGIFRRAMRVWGLTVNPAAAELVERPPVRYSGDFKTLTPDEVRLAAAHADSDQEAALIVAAAFTGLRQGELLGLRWEDVDFANERLQVRRNFTGRTMKTPKSGKVRSSPMVPEVMAALDGLSRRESLTEPGDPVFPTEEGEHGGSGRCAGASIRRWSGPGCRGFTSTTCATVSPRSLCRSSRCRRCRATWAMRISRPRCATYTIRRPPRTRRSWPRR